MTGQKKERYWSRYALKYDDYAECVIGKVLRQAILKRLSEECDLGEVIEFGCGTGYFTEAIAKNAKRVVATDLSDEMIEVTKERLKEWKNVSVEKADCESIPFPPETCDTVFMANVLHVIEHPLKALQGSYEVLKRGRVLLVVSYTDYGMNWIEKMQLGIRYFVTFGIPPPHGLRNYSPEEIGRLIESAGFALESVDLLGDGPRALYLKARKK